MGMSAGQARLLSVTSRLTDNELRSQMLTNSKLRLADKSTEASNKYMDALNSEKLTFKSYNGDGSSTSSDLTPQLLYTYQSLKNQYAIRNSSGQYLVSGTDAKNYEQSASLYAFLNCYGLVDSTLYEEYNADLEEYENYLDEYNQYLKDYAQYQKDYAAYEASLTSVDLYTKFSEAVGTKDVESDDGAAYCYYHALRGNASCYLHLLNEILDFDGSSLQQHTYTTSTGQNVTTNASQGGMWGYANDDMHQISDALNETDADGNPLRYCDGDDDLNTDGEQNILAQAIEAGRKPTKLELLQSDYILEADGTYSKKSLKQKAIDMYYIIQNGLVTDKDTMYNMLVNFTDGDMKKLTIQAPPRPTAPDVVEEPQKPAYDIIVNDSEKAQWYVNLWYMMNGSESANKVTSGTTEDGLTYYGVSDSEKNEAKSNYKEIDANLLTSPEWLEFALTNGLVTLSQATYYNPSTDGSKEAALSPEGYTWTSIIYTNAPDVISVEDEVAIARAEVEYENAVREIQNEDKKIDQDLKKLDTEHNALQTEYDSIKSVIDKNVERSFKAFS